MSVGRPSKLDDNMRDAAEHYVDNHKDFDDPVPSIVGMACALRVCEKTLYNWAENDDAFLQTFTRCQAMQHKKLLAGGLTNDFSGVITKLMLSNHGYFDKQEQTLQGPGGGPIQTDNHWTIEVIEPDEE